MCELELLFRRPRPLPLPAYGDVGVSTAESMSNRWREILLYGMIRRFCNEQSVVVVYNCDLKCVDNLK